MQLILLAIIIIVVGGALSLLAGRWTLFSKILGLCGIIAGSVLGIAGSVPFLIGAPTAQIHISWSIPYGSFSVGTDALSAIFLIPIFTLVALSAIYGFAYLDTHEDENAGLPWFFLALLAASMALVAVAQNGILFLIAWESMTLSSYFLVTHESDKPGVAEAGWIYLIAAHIGTAFLLALFIMLGRQSGSMDFASWSSFASLPPASAGILFIFAVIGFGTKAGFMPLHIWLPKAHPAAPSHVSAIMSGVMIKTGIYGLMRAVTFLGAPRPEWGWILIGVGALSGILGVACAIAQHGIKSLLAYHSVENIGIIAMGLGLGILGLCGGNDVVAALGIGGALLHVINHALFKGLLFLGAGAVIKATGTGAIDLQGGLLKRMPQTGLAFLIGSAAISGLPPLNGFVSELMIYVAAFVYIGTDGKNLWHALPAILVIAALAFIGGLASACFAKVFGIIFLGEPRSKASQDAHESPAAMRLPMFILAISCVALGLLAPFVVGLLLHPIISATGLSISAAAEGLSWMSGIFSYVSIVGAVLLVLVISILSLRRSLLKGRKNVQVVTWDCGFAKPTPRMQYTSSSFAAPIVSMFGSLIGVTQSYLKPEGIFPSSSARESVVGDIFGDRMIRPLFDSVLRGVSWFRMLQHGSVNVYVLYIAITLVVLLVWKFGSL